LCFTVDCFSGFMRDAMKCAGLPLDCKPHGLRKTLGRRLADAGVSAHDIMAAPPRAFPGERRCKKGAEEDYLAAQPRWKSGPIPPIRKTRKIACPKTTRFAGLFVTGRTIRALGCGQGISP